MKTDFINTEEMTRTVLVEKAPIKVITIFNPFLVFYVNKCTGFEVFDKGKIMTYGDYSYNLFKNYNIGELIKSYKWLYGVNNKSFKDYFIITKSIINGQELLNRIGQIIPKEDCQSIK